MSFFVNKKENDNLYKTIEYLHLRNGPSTEYESITIIPKGDTLIVNSINNSNWHYISYNDLTGYSRSTYLEKLNEQNIDFNIFLFAILFPFVAIFSGLIWRFRFIASIISFIYGFLNVQWIYLGDIDRFTLLTIELFSLSFTTLFLGFFDSFYFLTMKKSEFNATFN